MVKSFNKIMPGILFSLTIAITAYWLGRLFPLVGGPVFGILIGILINNIWGTPAQAVPGVKFTSKKILQFSIIVLGGGLSLTQVFNTGVSSFSVMIFTLSAAFLAAYGFGKIMGIDWKMTSLIGTGTAICGGSAIAAISPIIEADNQKICYSISTIFLFNVLAVLIFPALGHLMGLTDEAFGLWSGTAINDTSSVVAAGYVYSAAAGSYATIVKLTRTTMIIPIALIYAVIMFYKNKNLAQGSGTKLNYSFSKIFPWFILGFLATSLLNTLGIFQGQTVETINWLGQFLIIMALSAVGLGADFKEMRKSGFKPMLLGLIVWFTVSATGLIVQYTMGQL